jgi:hypothetical protein
MEINNNNSKENWSTRKYLIRTITIDSKTKLEIPDSENFQEVEIKNTDEFLKLSIEIGNKNQIFHDIAKITNSPHYIQKYIITK